MNNKRVLLVMKNFYDYHIKIIAEMRRQGYEVDHYEGISRSFICDLIRSKIITRKLFSNYLYNQDFNESKNLLFSTCSNKYDYLDLATI